MVTNGKFQQKMCKLHFGVLVKKDTLPECFKSKGFVATTSISFSNLTKLI